MSIIKNGALDQYDAGPFEQLQFEIASVEGVKSKIIAQSEVHRKYNVTQSGTRRVIRPEANFVG